MDTLRRLLPSPGHLIAFEAAGRLGSFTDAGRERNMSQAAVRYAVRGLERQLGLRLFRREHRRVTLTDAGARFFADVTQGLGVIRRSAETLRAEARGDHVTLDRVDRFRQHEVRAVAGAHPSGPDGRRSVHVLDPRGPFAEAIRALEERVAGLFGQDGSLEVP